MRSGCETARMSTVTEQGREAVVRLEAERQCIQECNKVTAAGEGCGRKLCGRGLIEIKWGSRWSSDTRPVLTSREQVNPDRELDHIRWDYGGKVMETYMVIFTWVQGAECARRKNIVNLKQCWESIKLQIWIYQNSPVLPGKEKSIWLARWE